MLISCAVSAHLFSQMQEEGFLTTWLNYNAGLLHLVRDPAQMLKISLSQILLLIFTKSQILSGIELLVFLANIYNTYEKTCFWYMLCFVCLFV